MVTLDTTGKKIHKIQPLEVPSVAPYLYVVYGYTKFLHFLSSYSPEKVSNFGSVVETVVLHEYFFFLAGIQFAGKKFLQVTVANRTNWDKVVFAVFL